jgi:predicted amidophosphoribosyltransferase
MTKGYNCGYDYNPSKQKLCRKCAGPNNHHEFQCFRYEKFNPNLCSVCSRYNHYTSDCKEVVSFPPKTQLNSIYPDGKN